MLTQKYELAKVQEAKEIPTAKVLDFPKLPERKSFPPRTAAQYFWGQCCPSGAVSPGCLATRNGSKPTPWIPGKVLAREVFETVKTASAMGVA